MDNFTPKWVDKYAPKYSVQVDWKSFITYQEEFLEGFKLYEALHESNINEKHLYDFLMVMAEFAFKTGEVIQRLAHTTLRKGVYLSEVEEVYKVDPELRQRIQDFIDILKNSGDKDKLITNLAITKAQVSNSIGNLLQKFEIGEDMLQCAVYYEKVEQADMAKDIYQGIMNDFESESVKLSSGIFPEMTAIDDRPEKEIKIFNTAKEAFERLSGQTIAEPKRIHINEDEKAKELVVKMEKDIQPPQADTQNGFWDKLKRFFK